MPRERRGTAGLWRCGVGAAEAGLGLFPVGGLVVTVGRTVRALRIMRGQVGSNNQMAGWRG